MLEIATNRRPSRNWMLTATILLVLMLLSSRSVPGQTVTGLHQIRNVYVEAFQGDSCAALIRTKLIQKLSRSKRFIIVDHVEDSDAILQGSAALWITGYYHSDPRIRYRTSNDTPVYTARLSLSLTNRQGNILWSASFKPRFVGSQYVSDNVTNQAVCQLGRIVR
jgi:hypothetical protein